MRITLIAIAGGSGSGKTWLAREMKRRLHPHAQIVSMDDFYADRAHLAPADRAAANYDAPGAIDWGLFHRCLEGILRGDTVWLPRYDFGTHTRRGPARRWRPKTVVLVEGLWPWRRAEVKRLYALKVFRSAPEEVRLARRLARDVAERERSEESVRLQWRRQVQPMYARFVRPQMAAADVTVPPDAPEWRLERLARKIQRVSGLSV